MPQARTSQEKSSARISRLLGEFRPGHLMPSLAAGFVASLFEVVVAISFAALIFAGDLSDFVANGIGLALLGAALSNLFVALFCTLPGTIGGSQDTPAAIMAVVAAGIAAALPASSSSQEALFTVGIAIAVTTMLTGIFFIILGVFELGSLVRFLPYPVIGGFLAGTGWLLVTGGVGLMAGVTPSLNQFEVLIRPEILSRWLPGLFLAVLLLTIPRRIDHYLVLPGMISAAVVLFYLLAWIGGVPGDELGQQGWLLGPFPTESLWPPLPWSELGQVNWAAIGGQLPNIGALVLLSTVGLLLNSTGLGMAVHEEVSLNRELRAAGAGNLAAGLVGGLVGYQQLGLSALGIRLGASTRLAGLIFSGVCLVVVAAGASLLSFFPKVVVGGVLLFLGLSFLKEWVFDAWFRLPRSEFAIILCILMVIGTVGFLEGVVAGLVAAIVLFVVAYSRIDVIRHELTGEHIASRVRRSPVERQRLLDEGHRLYILRLQGFIFFGTAERLLNQVRRRLAERQPSTIQVVLLDFRRVTGLDSTAMLSLGKLRAEVASHKSTLVIAEASAAIRSQLEKGGLACGESIRFYADIDRGVEWGEEELLDRLELTDMAGPETLIQQLAQISPETTGMEAMIPYLERLEVDAGDRLIEQGSEPDCLFFVESGQVTAQLEFPDREPVRLETMSGGHVVGELGFYLGQERTASVVVDAPGVVFRLTRQDLARIEQENPAAASALHRLIVHLLSQRVTHLVRTVDALER